MFKHPLPFRLLLAATLGLGVLITLVGFNVVYPTQADNANGVMALAAPPFLRVARAEEAAIASVISAEAGMAAYFQTPSPIDLAAVRGQYRTIERETADYILGSAAVANYGETEDVHLYIHKAGWIMTYYLETEPSGKIFDWVDYQTTSGAAITTKLENVIANVLVTAGIPFTVATYYDFRYPNATHLMLIADAATSDCSDSFQVILPGSYSFFERGWFATDYGRLFLNSEELGWADYDANIQGTLLATQLRPDELHTVLVERTCESIGGLALVYREQ
jgi:hypothetical protein